jgi:tripartite-type tricarboxylate transporter receptor subunit TctC
MTLSLSRRALGALVAGLPAAAWAETFPTQPIRLVVPFAPGNATDITARVVAPRMSETLGQSVVIDNRSGASGVVGSESVARATPDGHTVVMGTIASHCVAPLLMRTPPYSVLDAFAPVMLFVSLPNMLAVHPSVPAQSVDELVAHAKRTPGGLDYGSVGNGSSSHLAGEMLRARTGAPLNHIPYRDAAQAVTALLAGQIPMLFYAVAGVLPHIRDGRLRALAVASAGRNPEAPTVPTMLEAGVPDFVVEPWIGMFAPARTPAAAIQRLHDAGKRAIATPAVASQLKSQGFELGGQDPGAFRNFIAQETARWSDVIRSAGVTQG